MATGGRRGPWEDGGVSETIEVQEQGTPVAFSFDEMLRYSGPGSPGGVALGFKLMERAFAALEPAGLVERRDVVIDSAFPGPGVRDACELVTRGYTEGRYLVDAGLERPERGDALSAFAFRVTYQHRSVILLLREGFVSDEFIRLVHSPHLSADEERTFTALKRDLAERLMASGAPDVFDVE